jgi:hypothetical protein
LGGSVKYATAITRTRVVVDVIKVQALQVRSGEYQGAFKISQDRVITIGELIRESGERRARRQGAPVARARPCQAFIHKFDSMAPSKKAVS